MGLQRTQDVVAAVDKGIVVVPLSFSVTGGAATSLKGDLLASVTYSAAGSYVLNLTDVGYDIISAIPGLNAASASGGSKVESGVLSTKAIALRLYNSANTLADPASANDRLSLVLYLKKTAVKAGGGPL